MTHSLKSSALECYGVAYYPVVLSVTLLYSLLMIRSLSMSVPVATSMIIEMRTGMRGITAMVIGGLIQVQVFESVRTAFNAFLALNYPHPK